LLKGGFKVWVAIYKLSSFSFLFYIFFRRNHPIICRIHTAVIIVLLWRFVSSPKQ